MALKKFLSIVCASSPNKGKFETLDDLEKEIHDKDYKFFLKLFCTNPEHDCESRRLWQELELFAHSEEKNLIKNKSIVPNLYSLVRSCQSITTSLKEEQDGKLVTNLKDKTISSDNAIRSMLQAAIVPDKSVYHMSHVCTDFQNYLTRQNFSEKKCQELRRDFCCGVRSINSQGNPHNVLFPPLTKEKVTQFFREKARKKNEKKAQKLIKNNSQKRTRKRRKSSRIARKYHIKCWLIF